MNGFNMRMMIGDALYKIHFPTMTGQDFANSVTTIKGLLTESEIAQVFQKIMVLDNADVECPFPSTYRCERSHFHASEPVTNRNTHIQEKHTSYPHRN